MIIYTNGDIFNSDAQALVNPVNCVGVAGKGLALEFKRRFPKNHESYHHVCKTGWLAPGRILIVEDNGKTIINFPTKRHWRDKSNLDDIELGLATLRKAIIHRRIESIAIPAIGCGLGGLDWSKVQPLIEQYLIELPCQITVYLPKTKGNRGPAWS